MQRCVTPKAGHQRWISTVFGSFRRCWDPFDFGWCESYSNFVKSYCCECFMWISHTVPCPFVQPATMKVAKSAGKNSERKVRFVLNKVTWAGLQHSLWIGIMLPLKFLNHGHFMNEQSQQWTAMLYMYVSRDRCFPFSSVVGGNFLTKKHQTWPYFRLRSWNALSWWGSLGVWCHWDDNPKILWCWEFLVVQGA